MKGRINKKITCFFLLILILNAMPVETHSVSQSTISKSKIIEPQAEKISWYYRDVPGGKQKRLWSRTYGHWITDWIWL